MRRKELLIGALVGAILGGLLKSPYVRPLAAIPFFALDRELLDHRLFLLAGIAAWCLFSIYWEAAARTASTAHRSESGASRAVHVTLVNLAFLLIIVPIRGFGRFIPAVPFLMAAGGAVEALGLLLAIWARRHLGRNWSGEITIKVEHQLIRSGPYKLLRHPIYTGLLTMYVGLTLVTGEWLAMVGLALAVFAYIRKIRLEEAILSTAFGPDYAAYRRSTRALIPGFF
jgi:protein-S-isoprenylcysteine O-methyltransferase Ste14